MSSSAVPGEPVLPVEVASERLRLPLWDAATVQAIRAGERWAGWHPEFPREDDVDAASMWRDGDTWSSRSVVSAKSGLVMGSIGFFGPPEPAADGVLEVEVGYGLVEAGRGHGAMTEALTAMLAYVDGAGVRVRASVAPANVASLRVLTKLGFTDLRGTTDDGELVLVRSLR